MPVGPLTGQGHVRLGHTGLHLSCTAKEGGWVETGTLCSGSPGPGINHDHCSLGLLCPRSVAHSSNEAIEPLPEHVRKQMRSAEGTTPRESYSLVVKQTIHNV